MAEFVKMFEREFDSLLFIGIDFVDSVEVIAGRVDADHGERPVVDPEFFSPVLIGDGDCSGDYAVVEGVEIGGGDQDGAIVSMSELFMQGLQKQCIVAGKKVSSGDQGDVPDSGAMVAEFSSDIQHMGAHARGDLRGTAEHPRYGCRRDICLLRYGSYCRFHCKTLCGTEFTIAAERGICNFRTDTCEKIAEKQLFSGHSRDRMSLRNRAGFLPLTIPSPPKQRVVWAFFPSRSFTASAKPKIRPGSGESGASVLQGKQSR